MATTAICRGTKTLGFVPVARVGEGVCGVETRRQSVDTPEVDQYLRTFLEPHGSNMKTFRQNHEVLANGGSQPLTGAGRVAVKARLFSAEEKAISRRR